MYAKTKRNKYGNKGIVIDGIHFQSTLEGRRYSFLNLMQAASEISDLRRQVRYELIPPIKHKEVVHLKTKDKEVEKTDQLGIYYTADFVYTKTATGETIVEDVKGSKFVMSADAPLRFKLFFWRYGIKVRIVTKPNETI